MAKDLTVKLEAIHPSINGDYPIEGVFTSRDWYDLKRIAGVLPPTFLEALEQKDQTVWVALAVIALRRAGKRVNDDVLWDAEGGKITLDGGEDDAGPPDQTPTGSGSEPQEQNASSGDGSLNGSDPPDPTLAPTGLPLSERSATSELEMSEI